ncbi:MAG TPA: serine/threonine-protein kinase [Polyangia bacterium]|nr:serine/threonine-protein kinase [Polyangia bacterium]
MIGRTLGSYTIVERIGAGGMGEVYLAKHRRIERKVAVKLLLPALSSDPDIVNRFFNEARATSLITHPGIVQIYDCDVFENRAYIVMEYLEGANLNTVLARSGPFDIPMAVWITGQIAGALAAAHAKSIVHRDLKPENVFLAEDPLRPGSRVVKILDFGIAKLTDRASPASHTRTGSILGTPIYMAPEQCRGLTSIDHRADVYALGGILFELLTGRPPFVKEAPGDLLVAHVSEPPPVPSSLMPAIPPELDRLILRMLAKAPNDRPQSMDLVTRELITLHAGAADPAGPMGSTLRLDAAPAPPTGRQVPSAGGTRLLPENHKKTSTLGLSAAEMMPSGLRPRSRAGLWLAVGGVAAAVAVVAVLRPDRMLAQSTVKTGASVDSPRPAGPLPHAAVDVPAGQPTPEPARPEPATVTLQLESMPPGAGVWVGNASEPRGRTPLRLVVAKGQAVRATLRASGYADREVALDTDRDQTIEVSLSAVEPPHHAHATATRGGHRGAGHGPAAARATDTPAAEATTPAPPPAAAQKKYFLLGD